MVLYQSNGGGGASTGPARQILYFQFMSLSDLLKFIPNSQRYTENDVTSWFQRTPYSKMKPG